MKSFTPFFVIILIISPAVINLSGCTSILPDAHKIDIQQGNSLKTENINKLSQGMTEKQVIYLLGTPVIRDTFHPDRWDYIYTFKHADAKTEQKRLTLFFTNGKLTTIENHSYQAEPVKPENESRR